MTVKKVYLPKETVLSNSDSWKPRKPSEELVGRSNLSYKREKEPADW